jgi:hypothetical protein
MPENITTPEDLKRKLFTDCHVLKKVDPKRVRIHDKTNGFSPY